MNCYYFKSAGGQVKVNMPTSSHWGAISGVQFKEETGVGGPSDFVFFFLLVNE